MDWLRQLPIGQYVDDGEGRSWLNRLDPRLKLAWTIAFLVTPVLAGPLWRLGLVALLLLLTLVSGLPLRLWRRSLPLLLALALLVGLLATLLPTGGAPAASLQRAPQELRLSPGPAGSPAPTRAGLSWELLHWGPLQLGPLEIGPLVVTRRSAELGINGGTLLVTVIQSANLMLISTQPEDLVWALSWWLQPLTALGLPMERLGFTLLLSLRFLPLVQEEFQNLLRSLATRAIHFRALGWKRGLRVVLALGERLLANVLLRSEQGAEALMARGGRWLPADRLHQPPTELGVVSLLALGCLALLLGLRWTIGAL
ncbi:MAG: energy-coupling factor transporter transmembrane component T [Synechococcaceae cyanobacterium]|nr:energy-coupling factor transporter transmembrane component T [Synechococcaceae cyanobacterium]